MMGFKFVWIAVVVGASVLMADAAAAGQIFASGRIDLGPGGTEDRYFSIDTTTGVATAISPVTVGIPTGLAGGVDGELFGVSGGQLSGVDPTTAVLTSIGPSSGLASTALDVLADGRGFFIPIGAATSQQLFSVDTTNGNVAAVSASMTEIGDAIDSAAGNPLGTTDPFIISLGSVGETLYAIDLDSNSLIALDPTTGTASVVGAVGAVDSVGGGDFGGYAALTGVDENGDGAFDALFGAVNFFNDPDLGSTQIGGVARFDLSDGTWTLVGTNPDVIFFGFGSSPIPEPTSLALLVLGAAGVLATRRRRQ